MPTKDNNREAPDAEANEPRRKTQRTTAGASGAATTPAATPAPLASGASGAAAPAATRAPVSGASAAAVPAATLAPASGGASGARGAPPPLADLLATGFVDASEKKFLSKWAVQVKTYVHVNLVTFLTEHKEKLSWTVPSEVLLFTALEIKTAASGAQLTSFREVMNHENLELSFRQSSMYEAAGTIFMCDFVSEEELERIRPCQLDHAAALWTEEAYLQSSTHAPSRRYSFDVPIPVKVEDPKVAQKKHENSSAVVMAHALPVLAGRAILMTWYAAMAEALAKKDEDRVFKLLEAGLSVPIRLRLCPDGESCCLAGLFFSEALFAASTASGAVSFWAFAAKARRLGDIARALTENASVAKVKTAGNKYGLTFKSKSLTDNQVKALKALDPFLEDEKCNEAYDLTEAVCPEIMDVTILMRICQLSSSRATCIPAADSFVFAMDCLRALRLTGTFQGGEYTLAAVTGQEKSQPALMHSLFKKQELTEFICHELKMRDEASVAKLDVMRTPLSIASRFSASGESGLVTALRAGDASASEGFESMFAMRVAEYRDADDVGEKAAAAIDFLWNMWCGQYKDEIKELIVQELQSPSNNAGFLWHRYLTDSNKEMGAKYRAFVEACTAGPTVVPVDGGGQQTLVGASELPEEDQAQLAKIQGALLTLRRKTVTFTPLPTIGGASGAEYTKVQLDKVWEGSRLGYKYMRKKTDVRAFVLSAESFPPNVGKQGLQTSLSEQLKVDKERFARTIEYIAQRRSKDDVVILCDGRGRDARKVIESFEEKLTASGVNAYVENWLVYTLPKKTEDPRVPAKQSLFANNNQEVVVCSLAAAKNRKWQLTQRSEFNTCGESSTASRSYTGIRMRQYLELPRMDADTKAACVGVAASGAVPSGRVQKDIDKFGHPFSHAEVKPLAWWQRMCEHLGVTHIIDFAAGSGALAVAVAGSMEYEGICANEAHCKWLDSILDKCIMYLAGKEKEFAKRLGGDDAFVAKVGKYFGGMMVDARRMLEPPSQSKSDSDDDGDDDDDSDDDDDDGSSGDGGAKQAAS